MTLSHLNKSMEYERAHSEMDKVRRKVGEMRNAAEEEARKNGSPRPAHYDIIMDDLLALQAEYRKMSDKEYAAHKATHIPHDEGITNLANAVVLSAIEDYEEAISSGRVGAGGVIRSIRRFAETESGFYTTADVPGILTRIDAAYKKFKTLALANVDGIKAATKRIQRNEALHKFYSHYSNPYRCPLCGGGLWFDNGKEKRIRCGSCYLSVKTENERKEDSYAHH